MKALLKKLKIVLSLGLFLGLVFPQLSFATAPQEDFSEMVEKIHLDNVTARRLISILNQYQNNQRVLEQKSISDQKNTTIKSWYEYMQKQDELLFRQVKDILNPNQVSTFVVLFKEYKQMQRSVNEDLKDEPVSPAFYPAPTYLRAPIDHVSSSVGVLY